MSEAGENREITPNSEHSENVENCESTEQVKGFTCYLLLNVFSTKVVNSLCL